jgi:hypothetical protein
MRRLLPALLAVAFAARCGTAARTTGPAPVPGTTSGRPPYDEPPAAAHEVSIRLDLRAAREILAALSAAKVDPTEIGRIEALPAVKAAIEDSGRGAEVFGHDLAASFEEEGRPTVFDFRQIRTDRSKWQQLLSALSMAENEVTTKSARRAASLLPADHVVAVRLPIYFSFGLPGRAEYLSIPSSGEGGRALVVDLARVLADSASSSIPGQIDRLSRLIAGEAFRRGWETYRAVSPAWQRKDASLGPLEPLLRAVAEAGPPALYNVDENFFPLAVWLREPMRDSIDELNRIAERLVSSEADLDARVETATEVKRPDFGAKVAGPAGSFLADGTAQTLGVPALRTAMAGGPRTFFEAYDQAQQKRGKELIPLARAIRELLAAAPAGAP